MSVISPDIEQWLCDYLRDRVYDVEGLQFDNRKPEAYRGDYPLVTIRDDSGSRRRARAIRSQHRRQHLRMDPRP